MMNDSEIAQPNMVEYDVTVPEAGRYELNIQYASMEGRSAQLFINDALQPGRVLTQTSGVDSPSDAVLLRRYIFIS